MSSADHRDIARVLRAEAKKNEQKLNRSRSKFYKEQASYHEEAADREDTIDELENKMYNILILWAKEMFFAGGKVGHLINQQNQNLSILIIQHPMIGNLMFDYPTARIPRWCPVWNDQLVTDWSEDITFDTIEDYVKQS